MANIKDLFMDLDDSGTPGNVEDDNAVEVYADSVRQALKLASEDLGVSVDMLDYEVIEKGSGGFFGFGRLPYRVLVRPTPAAAEQSDLDEIERKLSAEHPATISTPKKDADGECKVRVTRSGIWLTVTKPRGRGRKVEQNDVNAKLMALRIESVKTKAVEAEVAKPSGEPVKIGEWTPNQLYDGSMNIEITEDEMKAFIHFSPPRFSGRHMEFDEVVDLLRKNGVVTGIQEDDIRHYLDEMDYSRPLLAARGEKPRHGKDAYVDYKVRIDSSGVSFEEDESGKVDFHNMDLLENVVAGQLLAKKVPAEEGIMGRTIKNRLLPAKSGKDMKMQFGKGTILSEDGTELTAEINGQVVYKNNKLSVESVYVVPGDVSLETGNIVFLGSVVVQGNVQDNFVVKAAGNIEVKGTVQKAFLEAEGDIILRQGLMGRNEAKVESTGGSIYAKFIQNANVVAEKDIIVPEGIVHSNCDAGENVFSNGKRARIVGGRIRVGNEVNVRYLGADVNTRTEIWAGINPKILQQMTDLDVLKAKISEEYGQVKLNLRSLDNQHRMGKLSKEREKVFADLQEQEQKMATRLEEIGMELEELRTYIDMLELKGNVCAEKSIFPGVDIYIKDKKFSVRDEYKSVKFTMQGGDIKIAEYTPPEPSDMLQKVAHLGRRR